VLVISAINPTAISGTVIRNYIIFDSKNIINKARLVEKNRSIVGSDKLN
jgi:hypothetical protein